MCTMHCYLLLSACVWCRIADQRVPYPWLATRCSDIPMTQSSHPRSSLRLFVSCSGIICLLTFYVGHASTHDSCSSLCGCVCTHANKTIEQTHTHTHTHTYTYIDSDSDRLKFSLTLLTIFVSFTHSKYGMVLRQMV